MVEGRMVCDFAALRQAVPGRPFRTGACTLWCGALSFVALASVGLGAGCAHPIATALQDARDADSPSPDLLLTYEEVGGTALGQDRFELRGLTLLRKQHGPGFASGGEEPESLVAGAAPASEEADARMSSVDITAMQLQELLELLLEIEAWDQQQEYGMADDPLEQARATLTIDVGERRSEVWEWVNDMVLEDRLLKVKLLLERLTQTQQSRPNADE